MQRVTGPRHAAMSLDKIALHHYVLKSREVPPLTQLPTPVSLRRYVSC